MNFYAGTLGLKESRRFGDAQHFLPDMPMSKMAMGEPIGIFIFNAIFQRFPKLRLGMIESGVGWFAWYTEYATRTWEKQRFWTKSPLKNPPSYYMERNVWGSFIQDRAGILMRDLPGGKETVEAGAAARRGPRSPAAPRWG